MCVLFSFSSCCPSVCPPPLCVCDTRHDSHVCLTHTSLQSLHAEAKLLSYTLFFLAWLDYTTETTEVMKLSSSSTIPIKQLYKRHGVTIQDRGQFMDDSVHGWFSSVVIQFSVDSVQCWFSAWLIQFSVDSIHGWFSSVLIQFMVDSVQCWFSSVLIQFSSITESMFQNSSIMKLLI